MEFFKNNFYPIYLLKEANKHQLNKANYFAEKCSWQEKLNYSVINVRIKTVATFMAILKEKKNK